MHQQIDQWFMMPSLWRLLGSFGRSFILRSHNKFNRCRISYRFEGLSFCPVVLVSFFCLEVPAAPDTEQLWSEWIYTKKVTSSPDFHHSLQSPTSIKARHSQTTQLCSCPSSLSCGSALQVWSGHPADWKRKQDSVRSGWWWSTSLAATSLSSLSWFMLFAIKTGRGTMI